MVVVNDNRQPRWKRWGFFVLVFFWFEKWKLEPVAEKSLLTENTSHVTHIQKPALSSLVLDNTYPLVIVIKGLWRLSVAVRFSANSWQILGREGRRWMALSLLVNWKLCRRARNLPEILIDKGILQREGQGRRPDAPIDDCHLLHCRRAGPIVTKTVRAKL